MRVLVVGSGGREHAMCLALRSTHEPLTLFAAPGNPGIARCAELIPVAAMDIPAVVAAARALAIDLVLVGPEGPLAAGLCDALRVEGIPCCGPSAAAARLESSKAFARTLAAAVGVPAPRHRVVHGPRDARSAIAELADGAPPVVKLDGLAAGKGAFLPETLEECERLAARLLRDHAVLVLEERLQGVEASLFYACSGTTALALPHAHDYKRLGDADTGPNTGGMGAVSPNPAITRVLDQQVRERIVEPVLNALAERGAPFSGFLFPGVMLTRDGPKLLEFNVRLGDPEAQAILPRLRDGDFLSVCRAVAHQDMAGAEAASANRATCAIVLAAPGYPDAPVTGAAVRVDPAVQTEARWLIHAGTATADGALVTAGGRVASVVAADLDAEGARRTAYDGLQYVHFEGKQWRRDIGAVRRPA